MSNIEELLDEEIKSQIDALKDCEIGKGDYAETVNGISKLIDKSIELKKLEISVDENARKATVEKENRMFDEKTKQQELEADKKDRKIRNWLTAAGIGIPVGVTIWANIYNWKKELGGTMTFSGGRKAMDSLLSMCKIKK